MTDENRLLAIKLDREILNSGISVGILNGSLVDMYQHEDAEELTDIARTNILVTLNKEEIEIKRKIMMQDLIEALKDPAFVAENRETLKQFRELLFPKISAPEMEMVLEDYKKCGLLSNKYDVRKTDGTPIHPEAFYFVLRIDNFGKDPIHIDACREAIITYAQKVKNHLPLLADDLIVKIKELKK